MVKQYSINRHFKRRLSLLRIHAFADDAIEHPHGVMRQAAQIIGSIICVGAILC
jgi:hypothetical protein